MLSQEKQIKIAKLRKIKRSYKVKTNKKSQEERNR